MKPIAVINVARLADTEIDQPAKLQKEGYVVIFANDGPAITLHQAAPDRRERIATAVLAGLMANPERANTSAIQDAELAVSAAHALIRELNK